jgi:hypothetical protein
VDGYIASCPRGQADEKPALRKSENQHFKFERRKTNCGEFKKLDCGIFWDWGILKSAGIEQEIQGWSKPCWGSFSPSLPPSMHNMGAPT